MSAGGLVERLARARIGETFNFYREGAGARIRRDRLRTYLGARRNAAILLVAEAPGYRGTRVSGIPLTSERQLSGSGPSEATATVVHRALAGLGIERDVVLWNVVPTHPHLRGRPESNRRPTRIEIEASRPFLAELAQGRRLVALGRVAASELGAPYVRHPSYGGAAAFYDGLRRILARAEKEGDAMDESTVREHAEAHGRAVVEGDLRRAAGDLSEEARRSAQAVMAQLPSPLRSAQVTSVEAAGDEYLARIRYAGEQAAATVEARWAEAGDRPKIVALAVVD